MTLDDGEEILRGITAREDNGLSTKGSHLRAANVEGIAMGGEPWQRDVVGRRGQGITQTGTIDIELKPVLLTGGIEAGYLVARIDRAVFGWEGDIDHARLGAMLAASIVHEGAHEVVQFGHGQFAIVARQRYHFMAGSLDGRGFVHVDMAGIDGDHGLVGTHHAINDGGIGLRAAHQEEDFGIRCAAGHAYLLLGLFAIYIKSIGCRRLGIGFHESLYHLRMRPVVVVTFKRDHIIYILNLISYCRLQR